MNCSQCGNKMVDSHMTFTVIKDSTVFVTEGVPCLECLVCGHSVIKQDVAKQLQGYSFGEKIPNIAYRAFGFRWGDSKLELSQVSSPSRTENTPISMKVPVGTVA